jgi:SAM-dependent methyltransferase
MTTYRSLVLSYGCDRTRLTRALSDVFVELDCDASTRAWIDQAFGRPQSPATIAARNAAMKTVSLYDANGLAGAYSMRVLSTAQWRTLIGPNVPTDRRMPRLLDIGAGDGAVTSEIGELFEEVVTTELSTPMADRLRAEGYVCHEVDLAVEPLPGGGPFDVVSLQNLIDRTSHPLALLTRVRQLIEPSGRVVVAVPLPVTQAVYTGTRRLPAAQKLPSRSKRWEGAAADLYEEVFRPLGYRALALTRAPYLCCGEAAHPVKVLDDAIFVLSAGG